VCLNTFIVLSNLFNHKVLYEDFLEPISLILQANYAAKYSSRACGLQRPQSAELIFHKLKFGSSQVQQENAS